MKLTDGLLHQVFREMAVEYPELETEHMIVDIGIARIADTPEAFDVIVMPNLYGDIASDVAAPVAGSVGLAGSANIGEVCAMFKAIHGSAPDIAGRAIANPSGLLHAATMMLVHIGQPEVAERIHNAWLATIEAGVETGDIARGGPSVGTVAFARAVVEHLGTKPQSLQPVHYETVLEQDLPEPVPARAEEVRSEPERLLDGVDVFLYNTALSPDELGRVLEEIAGPEFRLSVITNRGVKVYPGGFPETFLTDHWRCRFQAADP